jgi:hypothetical protein
MGRDERADMDIATQQVNERLAALPAAGTSVWLDQIKRSLLTTGEVRRLVEEESLRGVTSQPDDLQSGDPRLRRLRRAALRARSLRQGHAGGLRLARASEARVQTPASAGAKRGRTVRSRSWSPSLRL